MVTLLEVKETYLSVDQVKLIGVLHRSSCLQQTHKQGVSSHSQTLDMGDMGTIGFDQGTGAFGIGTIDDKMPTAYEEVWNGTTATTTDILDGNGGSAGVFGYKNTFMDTLVKR